MDIYCLEGKDDDGNTIIRVFTHLLGTYLDVARGIANKRGSFSSFSYRILSIEDVLQINDKGGQYLRYTSKLAESPNSCGLSLFAFEMSSDGDVNLWGPNPEFVREFEGQYRV